jgi:hypothetical protein
VFAKIQSGSGWDCPSTARFRRERSTNLCASSSASKGGQGEPGIMGKTRRIGRIGSVVAGAAAVLLVAAPSRAADKPKASAACNAAGVSVHAAHAAEAAGHTAEAVEAYRACAQETACGWLALKCDAKIKLLQSKLPTIVPVVNDESGQPVVDVEVRVDGAVRTSKLTGLGLSVEPGLHELSFSTGAGVFATEKVMVVEGEHDRPVTVTMHSPGGKSLPSAAAVAPPATDSSAEKPASPQAATTSSPPPASEGETKSAPAGAVTEVAAPSHWAMPRSALPYTIAAVGVAGIAAGVLTTVWGNKDNSNLEDQCSPHCMPSSLSHIKTLYIASDVSYGVGLAALGVATWMFASSRAPEKAPSAAATIVDIHPLPSGALASVSGRF